MRYVDPTGHDAIQESEAGKFLNDALRTGFGYAKGLVKRVGEGIVGAGITLARATQNLQKPEHQIPGLDPIGAKDVAAVKETGRFYGKSLANIRETGPAALDALTELGPERSGEVIGGTTADVVTTVEGGRALVGGATRAVRAAPTELGEVGRNLAGMFRGRSGSSAAVVVEQGATGPLGPFDVLEQTTVDPAARRPPLAGPSAGFARYVAAEKQINPLPMTVAEAEDALRMNAAMADLETRAAGVPRTFGRFGTHSHGGFETRNTPLDAATQAAGSPVSFDIEQFRLNPTGPGAAGSVTSRRAAGSLGLDVLVSSRGVPVRGFDLKTGRPWSATQLAEIERRFGVPVTQIKTR